VEMGAKTQLIVDLENDVIRPALLTHDGVVLPPPPKKEPTAPAPKDAAKASTPSATIKLAPTSIRPPSPKEEEKSGKKKSGHGGGAPTQGGRLGGLVLAVILLAVGHFAPSEFLEHFTVFVLACFVGWQVIWSVTPALHTPLMSVTNAISGIIIVGGMLEIGPDLGLATWLGVAAVLVAAINVAGGFLVTQRMLRMFRRG
jgi:NAD(P) transhydrogenase subunit alpha